jgi:hypothetical protein
MERVALMSDTSRIAREMLALPTEVSPGETPPAPAEVPLDTRVETWERQELVRALQETRWNVR